MAKAKARRRGQDVSDDDDDEDYEEAFNQARVPAPGQLANCELCDKRFTVTAYSKTGPDGGLLCTPCGKQMAADEKKAKPKPKRQRARATRQMNSNLLDGIAQRGAFSLLEMCIRVGTLFLLSSPPPYSSSSSRVSGTGITDDAIASGKQYQRCGGVWGSAWGTAVAAQPDSEQAADAHAADPGTLSAQ